MTRTGTQRTKTDFEDRHMTHPATAEDRLAVVPTRRPTRRDELTTVPNPAPQHDYVVTFSAHMDSIMPDRPLVVRLRYVPDRRVVDAAAFDRYLHGLGKHPWPSLEAVAAAIVDDFNNEVVARWVSATLSDAPESATHHAVLLEDRQPGWDNRALLARLEPA